MTEDNTESVLSKKKERTVDKIIKALKETNGLQSMAAQRAGVSVRTINRYANEFPSVAQAVKDAKEAMLDFTEAKLFQLIRDGDKIAIMFYLKTQGKARGYIERQEVVSTDGTSNRAEEFSDDELAAIIERRRSHRATKETASA